MLLGSRMDGYARLLEEIAARTRVVFVVWWRGESGYDMITTKQQLFSLQFAELTHDRVRFKMSAGIVYSTLIQARLRDDVG